MTLAFEEGFSIVEGVTETGVGLIDQFTLAGVDDQSGMIRATVTWAVGADPYLGVFIHRVYETAVFLGDEGTVTYYLFNPGERWDLVLYNGGSSALFEFVIEWLPPQSTVAIPMRTP